MDIHFFFFFLPCGLNSQTFLLCDMFQKKFATWPKLELKFPSSKSSLGDLSSKLQKIIILIKEMALWAGFFLFFIFIFFNTHGTWVSLGKFKLQLTICLSLSLSLSPLKSQYTHYSQKGLQNYYGRLFQTLVKTHIWYLKFSTLIRFPN